MALPSNVEFGDSSQEFLRISTIKTLRVLVDYKYTGSLNIDETNVRALFGAAEILELDCIRNECLSICTDIAACSSELTDVEILSEGRAYARLALRYCAFCKIDYSRFPEDQNGCCIYFTAFETDREVVFNVESDKTKKVSFLL
ncbi:hypothetical protein Q1695_011395 [Nippostrongylus brasiliensis]|nr:hypothetical protein Q1695_011395 [Nippostrongylus brasiliensis]